MNILRFYGSCGHIEDTEISDEKFKEWTAETMVKTILGDSLHKNEVTTEDENQIVHVHPFRYCCCYKCVMEDMKETWFCL